MIRRLKNTSRELNHEVVEQVILNYMQELREGGYPAEIREEIVKSAFKGYSKMWSNQCSNQGYVNRPGKATQLKRRAQKLAGQSTWFKQTSGKSEPQNDQQKAINRHEKNQTSVERILFCPYTPNSALKKELQKIEDFMNGTQKTGKVRIVERAGPKMSTLLSNRTPRKKERCGREDCPPCEKKIWILQSPKSCLQDNMS